MHGHERVVRVLLVSVLTVSAAAFAVIAANLIAHPAL